MKEIVILPAANCRRSQKVLVNPFDILEAPSCRLKERAAHLLFGLEKAA